MFCCIFMTLALWIGLYTYYLFATQPFDEVVVKTERVSYKEPELVEIRSELHQESLITKTFDEGTESINTQSILEPAHFTDTDNDESELTVEERLL